MLGCDAWKSVIPELEVQCLEGHLCGGCTPYVLHNICTNIAGSTSGKCKLNKNGINERESKRKWKIMELDRGIKKNKKKIRTERNVREESMKKMSAVMHGKYQLFYL